MNWPSVKLGNILKVKSGFAFKSKEFVDKGHPIIRISNIDGSKVNLKNAANVPATAVEGKERFLVKSGDILIAMSGATTGKLGVVPEGIDKVYLNQRVGKFHFDSNEICSKYLYYFLLSDICQTHINSLAAGAAQPNISGGQLESIEIPLPPLPLQKQIAAILEKADTLRGQCQQMEQELNTLAQSVFLEMFGDPVTNPMEWRKAGLKSISKKFNDGPFGSNLKTSHYTETGVQVIRLTNIGVGEFKNKDQMFVSEEHAETLSKFQCSPGDVVIATLGEPNLRACIIPDEVPLAINKADCIHCIPDGEVVGTEYLIECLNLPITLQSIQNLLHGQTRTRISSGQLAKVEILLPPLDKQEEFISFVKKRNAELIRVKVMYEQYNDLFNSLMQKAFKGELELKDVA